MKIRFNLADEDVAKAAGPREAPVALDRLFLAFGSPLDSTMMMRSTRILTAASPDGCPLPRNRWFDTQSSASAANKASAKVSAASHLHDAHRPARSCGSGGLTSLAGRFGFASRAGDDCCLAVPIWGVTRAIGQVSHPVGRFRALSRPAKAFA